MRRKVIQIADSTQLVSLPRKWAQRYGIKKGDELEIEEQGNQLVIDTAKEPVLSNIEIDLSGLDRTSILCCIQSLYKLGYDEIKLTFPLTTKHLRLNKNINVLSVIHFTVNRLPGYEVIQQKENFCIIKSIQEVTIKEFDHVLKRIFLLLNDACNDLVKGAKEMNKPLIETIEEKHDSITKFVHYCLRILNKKGYTDKKKTFVVYYIIGTIDKLADILKYTARDLLKFDKKLSKETIKLLESINLSFELYHKLFYNFELKTIHELSQNRDSIIKRISSLSKKISLHELSLLSYTRSSLDLILDITEARWSLQY